MHVLLYIYIYITVITIKSYNVTTYSLAEGMHPSYQPMPAMGLTPPVIARLSAPLGIVWYGMVWYGMVWYGMI